MDKSEQIAAIIATLPPRLKAVLDAALAAGHQLIDCDIGLGTTHGKTWLVLDHPLRIKPDAAPPGVKYIEQLNRDPQLWGFCTEDESLQIVTAKLRPMKLDPLPPGPENPTEKHIAQMKAIQEREENAAAERAAAAKSPPPPIDPKTLTPYDRFLNSMIMTFEMWHDGNGYDLDALKLLDAPELHAIEKKLIEHSPRDWRDIEALAQIDSDAARKAVEAGLHSSDEHVRRVARDYAGEKQSPEDREKLLLQSLAKDDLFGGLSQAIDEAAEFHPPAVVEALLEGGAANRTGQTAIHFAALLYYIHGKAKEPFDWDHRPFFLRFDTPSREERKNVFRELCETIGVDATKYIR